MHDDVVGPVLEGAEDLTFRRRHAVAEDRARLRRMRREHGEVVLTRTPVAVRSTRTTGSPSNTSPEKDRDAACT